jgi:nitroreductase
MISGRLTNDVDHDASTHDETLLNVLADRFSPHRFDPVHTIEDPTIDILLEAAGRAPSAGNSQPWAFIVGRRGGSIHTRLCKFLARSSHVWAPDAGLLLVNLAHIFVADTDMEFSEFARYDLGQAVAHLSIQAHSMGLSVHQFRAFDRDKIATEFGIPPHWEVTSMAAVGRAHLADAFPLTGGFGSSTDRQRLSTAQITWARDSGHG